MTTSHHIELLSDPFFLHTLITLGTDAIAVLKRGEVWGRVLCLCPMPYALCLCPMPMPYALCPMPYGHLMLLIKAIIFY